MNLVEIIYKKLYGNLSSEEELWASSFVIDPEEDIIYSTKPIKIIVNQLVDDENSGNVLVTGDKKSDQFLIKASYSIDESGQSIIENEDSIIQYNIEVFNTRKDAEKYYKSRIKSYIKYYGNLINKIKEYDK